MAAVHDAPLDPGPFVMRARVTGLSETIEGTKREVERTRDDLLKTFSFVPDDKLGWSPGGAARSALWLVGHCGATNHAFAAFLRGDRPDLPTDPALIAAAIRAGGQATRTREEAIDTVQKGAAEILAALDTVTEERLAGTSETPFGPMPFTIWIDAARTHMGAHARQLDYLQTIWGDVEDHW